MGKRFNSFINTVGSIGSKAVDATTGDSAGLLDARNNINGNSIKTKTKDLILQFPLLISQNVSLKAVSTLAEGFECEYAILVKLLLMNDLGGLTADASVKDVSAMLKQIHTNIDNSSPFLEMEAIKKENLRQLIPIEEKFNMYSLNEGTLPKYVLNEKTSFRKENEQGKENFTSEFNAEFVDKNPFDPKMFEKVNKLAPTFIQMNIHSSTSSESSFLGKNKETQDVDILFGVKCVAHPLRSDDIIHNLIGSFNNTTIFKLIKWTTGEYGFAKGIGEVIFDFDRMKNLGIQASKTGNHWWFKLRSLKNANRSKFIRQKKNLPMKTSTLICTLDEIDYIKTKYRIDLKDCHQAKKVVNDLFLLTFGYIDESTETVYLYDEVSGSYEVKQLSDFEHKRKSSPISVDDIKSLFGR